MMNEGNYSPTTMASEVILAFQGEADRKGLKLELIEEPNVPQTIRGDPNFRTVLSNILQNAIENSSSGTITIQIRHLEYPVTSLVEISIQDMGRGIHEDTLDLLFQEFEQILDHDEPVLSDSSSLEISEKQNKYIGLGLAVVARFIRNNHGQIRISSEPSRGTKVPLELPYREPIQESPGKSRRVAPPQYLPSSYQRAFGTRRSSNMSDQTHEVREGVPCGSAGESSPSIDTLSHAASSRAELLSSSSFETNVDSPSDARPAERGPSSSSSHQSLLNQYPFPSIKEPRNNAKDMMLSILVAEDNPLNSRLLKTRLQKKGHTVVVVVDGQSCADKFKKTPIAYDVILMDLQVI